MIYKKEYIDMSLVQCPYEEDRGYICIEDEYTNNILKLSGYSDIDQGVFYVLCEVGVLAQHLSMYALRSPEGAFAYALYVLGGRFELGEEMIAKDSQCSYLYAKDIIKSRFERGEDAIATDPKHSYRYAHFTNRKFDIGEPEIAKSPCYSYLYALEVLKGRFELGEQAISTNAEYSYAYAKDVLNGRFKLGEPEIKTNYHYKKKYQKLSGVHL